MYKAVVPSSRVDVLLDTEGEIPRHGTPTVIRNIARDLWLPYEEAEKWTTDDLPDIA